jgi:hypothetical protein
LKWTNSPFIHKTDHKTVPEENKVVVLLSGSNPLGAPKYKIVPRTSTRILFPKVNFWFSNYVHSDFPVSLNACGYLYSISLKTTWLARNACES